MATPQPSSHYMDPAADAGELIVRIGVFLLAVAVPVAATLSRRAIFPLTPIGVALIILGVALNPRRVLPRDFLTSVSRAPGLALLVFLVWSGLTIIWTPWVASGEVRFAKTLATVLLVVAAAAMTPPRTKAANLYLLPLGVALCALSTLILVVTHRFDSVAPGVRLADSTLARAAAGLVVTAWSALYALVVRERAAPAAALAIITTAAILAVGSPYVDTAAVAGAAAFVLSWRWPRQTGRTLAALAAALIILAPVLAILAGAVAPSVFARAPGLAHFIEGEGLRLITGHGYDTAAHVSATAGTGRDSFLFEIWFELGLVGALSAVVLAWTALIAASEATRPLAAFLTGAMTSGFVLAILAAPSSEIWWITAVSLAGLLFVIARRGRYRTKRPRAAFVTEEIRPPQPAA